MRFLALAVTILLTFLSTASLSETKECIPSFPYKDGWLGGDAAYSLKLQNGKSLWLFGDTFIGKELSSRAGSVMPANTIGISECNNKFEINYFWKKNGENNEAFFKSTPGDVKDWPLDAFEHDNKLYVFLEQIENDASDGLGFKTVSVKMAVISNHYESPENWEIAYQDLVADGVVFPGVAAVKENGYVYLFSVLDDKEHKKDHPMILLRLELGKLSQARENLEYFSADNQWKKGVVWQDAKKVMDTGSTEMSVTYNSYLKKWLALYKDTQFLSRNVVIRASDSLEGIWSEEKLVYEYPEMLPSQEGYEPETFCYAAKAHEQFSDSDKLIFTYACNTFNFTKLINNMDIYVPKTVIIDMPD